MLFFLFSCVTVFSYIKSEFIISLVLSSSCAIHIVAYATFGCVLKWCSVVKCAAWLSHVAHPSIVTSIVVVTWIWSKFWVIAIRTEAESRVLLSAAAIFGSVRHYSIWCFLISKVFSIRMMWWMLIVAIAVRAW